MPAPDTNRSPDGHPWNCPAPTGPKGPMCSNYSGVGCPLDKPGMAGATLLAEIMQETDETLKEVKGVTVPDAVIGHLTWEACERCFFYPPKKGGCEADIDASDLMMEDYSDSIVCRRFKPKV